MPPNPPNKAHGEATCKIPNLKKKFLAPPLPNPGDAPVLSSIIKELEEQYIPSKIVDVNRDDRFGEKLPNHIRMQIKKKHNLWKLYMGNKKA